MFNVSERRLRHEVKPIRNVLSEYYDRIDDLARRGEEIYGVPTGFIDLDKILGGLQPSDLLIIAGRPGQGKTGFLLSVAKNAALLHKKHVAVFSLEMSNEQVAQRLIAQQTGIDSQRLRSGRLEGDDWALFTQAIEVMSDTQIFLDDTPAITPLQLRTKCRRLHLEHRLDLILVDYLQLMAGDTRTENRVQEVSYISRNLKVLARELNVPVLAAAQLSRAVEQRADKEPQLSDSARIRIIGAGLRYRDVPVQARGVGKRRRQAGSCQAQGDETSQWANRRDQSHLPRQARQVRERRRLGSGLGPRAAGGVAQTKMKSFPGFSDSDTSTAIPDSFFNVLLKDIQDEDELRVILYALWRVERMEGTYRALSEAEFAGEAAGIERGRVASGLEKAVQRGALLRARHEAQTLYFLNSAADALAAQAFAERGHDESGSTASLPLGTAQCVQTLRGEYRTAHSPDRRCTEGCGGDLRAAMDRRCDRAGG